METIFTQEELNTLKKITNSYSTIFENSAYIKVQIEKLWAELNSLEDMMISIKKEEDELYEAISIREKISVPYIKTASFDFMLAEQNKK